MRRGFARQRLVVGDLRHQRVILILDPLALQGGQPAQLHVEDGLRLSVAQAETRSSATSLASSALSASRIDPNHLVQKFSSAMRKPSRMCARSRACAEQIFGAPRR